MKKKLAIKIENAIKKIMKVNYVTNERLKNG